MFPLHFSISFLSYLYVIWKIAYFCLKNVNWCLFVHLILILASWLQQTVRSHDILTEWNKNTQKWSRTAKFVWFEKNKIPVWWAQTFHQQLRASVFFLLKVSPNFLPEINVLCLNLCSRNTEDISEVMASQLSAGSFPQHHWEILPLAEYSGSSLDK